MCGIAGIFHRDSAPASKVRVAAMCDAIRHRGPDGEGQFVDGPLALGHRRLAIIDLSPMGAQPMTTADGRYVLTFNGEIYNFQELKAELAARGRAFVSRSDTEVLLKAFAAWGLGALSRLNGMFAFAVWDRELQTLTLARDRFGVKPLYYAQVGSTFLFASEVKAILAHGALSARMDPAGLAEYLNFQNFFTDRTLFRDVRLLPQGCYLQLGPGAPAEPTPVRYWDYRFQEPEGAVDEAAALDELDFLFQQAVSRQLVSDVDVGTYLSGGVDSGSIAALSARQRPYLRSFTVGFDLNSASGVEMSYDERGAAEYMSYLFKTEHYEMVLKAGDMERVIPRLARHLEEPRVGQCYPNFYAAQLAGKFVKVVMSGAGGGRAVRRLSVAATTAAVVNDDFDHYIDKYFAFWQRLVPQDRMARLLAPLGAEAAEVDAQAIFRGVFHEHADRLTRPEDYVNHSLYFEATTSSTAF